jgi:hypothetical protein
MTLPSQRTPGPDHAAPATGLLASLPFRTFLQGLGTDVGIAVCFVIYDALNSEVVDYRLLIITVFKTAVMVAVSYIMKRLKPPAGLESRHPK